MDKHAPQAEGGTAETQPQGSVNQNEEVGMLSALVVFAIVLTTIL